MEEVRFLGCETGVRPFHTPKNGYLSSFVKYWCASQTGKVLKVKVLAFKGLANRNDPNSCAWDSNGPCEALIGARAGQPLSCETHDILQSADVVSTNGRRHAVSRYARLSATLRSLRPCTCSETPCTGTGRARVCPESIPGCIGKSKDASQ